MRWLCYLLLLVIIFVALGYSGALATIFEPSIGRVARSLPAVTPFGDCVVDVFLYLLLSGFIQLVVVLAVGVLLLPSCFTRGVRQYFVAMNAFVEFNVTLLLLGALGNSTWAAITRGRMYVAGDPVVEWFPYLPYSRSIYDYDWGDFHGHLVGGASDSQLRLIWGALAICAWLGTWSILRFVHRKHVQVAAV